MKNRFLSITVSAALALAFVACGNNGSTNKEAEENNNLSSPEKMELQDINNRTQLGANSLLLRSLPS